MLFTHFFDGQITVTLGLSVRLCFDFFFDLLFDLFFDVVLFLNVLLLRATIC